MKKCLGCGTILQTDNKNKIGYTRNFEHDLCERCFKLKNYGEYKPVPLTNTDYLSILKKIDKKEKVFYITDVLTLDCPSIENFKNVTLIITKKDLLPKSTKESKIINYVKNIYKNIKEIYFISNNNEENIKTIYSLLEKEKHHPIYMVGITNSGKSTLINKIIQYKTNNTSNITTSMYPETTLDKIEIKINELTLIDTPGLVNKNNIINYLSEKEVKEITPKKTIKPKTCQIEGTGSIIIGHYLRLDYETKSKNSLIIYTSNYLEKNFFDWYIFF